MRIRILLYSREALPPPSQPRCPHRGRATCVHTGARACASVRAPAPLRATHAHAELLALRARFILFSTATPLQASVRIGACLHSNRLACSHHCSHVLPGCRCCHCSDLVAALLSVPSWSLLGVIPSTFRIPSVAVRSSWLLHLVVSYCRRL